MRPYENTWAPTIIHMDASDGGSCNRLLNELKGKERARDYWTSLIVKNITYEKQRELTLGTNRKMKSSIRKLHAKGFGFSLIGDPISLN
jgi:thioredoxin-related protein